VFGWRKRKAKDAVKSNIFALAAPAHPKSYAEFTSNINELKWQLVDELLHDVDDIFAKTRNIPGLTFDIDLYLDEKVPEKNYGDRCTDNFLRGVLETEYWLKSLNKQFVMEVFAPFKLMKRKDFYSHILSMKLNERIDPWGNLTTFLLISPPKYTAFEDVLVVAEREQLAELYIHNNCKKEIDILTQIFGLRSMIENQFPCFHLSAQRYFPPG